MVAIVHCYYKNTSISMFQCTIQGWGGGFGGSRVVFKEGGRMGGSSGLFKGVSVGSRGLLKGERRGVGQSQG